MPKHPFPSTAKTTRTVCKSGQRKMGTVGSACGVPSQPGAPLPLTVPRGPTVLTWCQAAQGGQGCGCRMTSQLGGWRWGGRARTQPSLGWASLGQARLALGTSPSSVPGASLFGTWVWLFCEGEGHDRSSTLPLVCSWERWSRRWLSWGAPARKPSLALAFPPTHCNDESPELSHTCRGKFSPSTALYGRWSLCLPPRLALGPELGIPALRPAALL